MVATVQKPVGSWLSLSPWLILPCCQHNPQPTVDHSSRAADIPYVALDAVKEPVGGGVVALRGDGRLAELALLARDDVAGREAPRDLLEALADAFFCEWELIVWEEMGFLPRIGIPISKSAGSASSSLLAGVMWVLVLAE